MPNLITRSAAAAAMMLSVTAASAIAQDVTDWDLDGDGALTEEEFMDGWSDTDLFSEWDSNDDGTLSEEEWNDGAFSSYDDDGNELLEGPEFSDIGTGLSSGIGDGSL